MEQSAPLAPLGAWLGFPSLAHTGAHAGSPWQRGTVFPKNITARLPEEVPSTAVLWATGTAGGPPRQTESLAVCCMNEEEKVRAARQLGTRTVPHLPVDVQPSSIHIGSLYPAIADTEAVPGGQLSE